MLISKPQTLLLVPKRARFTVQLPHIGIMTETRGDNGHFNSHFKLGSNDDSFKYKSYLVLTKLMLVLGTSHGLISWRSTISRSPLQEQQNCFRYLSLVYTTQVNCAFRAG